MATAEERLDAFRRDAMKALLEKNAGPLLFNGILCEDARWEEYSVNTKKVIQRLVEIAETVAQEQLKAAYRG